MSSAYMGRIDIDLNDCCPIGIELAPREIRSEQEQHITVEHSVIAGGPTDDAGHADIVGIIVFEEVLATRRVSQRRLQMRCGGHHLVMRTCTPGTRVDRDRIALVENGRYFIEVRVARANERTPRMDRIWGFLMRRGIV